MPPPPAGRRFAVTTQAQLLPWMLEHVPGMNRTEAKKLLALEVITVNGNPVRRHDVLLNPGDEVVMPGRGGVAAAAVAAAPPLPIIYEDAHLMVVEKPSGLLTMASDSERDRTAQRIMGEFVRARDGRTARILTVHRLDRETSGVLLLARDEATHKALQQNWDAARKRYLVVVDGRPRDAAGELVHWLREDSAGGLQVHVATEGSAGARRAALRYEVLTPGRARSLVAVDLQTGRKHQIRVQMAALGCPVAGDARYGDKHTAPRLALHAARLTFPHPATGETMTVESALPEILRRLIE